MTNDPMMRAEAEKLNLPLQPVAGDKLEESVQALFKVDPGAIAKVKALLQK